MFKKENLSIINILYSICKQIHNNLQKIRFGVEQIKHWEFKEERRFLSDQ